MKVITPLAVWAVSKLFDTPRVKGQMQEVDARMYVAQRDAMKSLRRAGRNAVHNPVLLAGGAAAVALGIGMISRASRSK